MEEDIIFIVLLIIIVSALYISFIQAIDYYHNSYGSSLSGRCGRDNIEVETARYHRYHHISQDGHIFIRGIMVIFSIYLLYMYLSHFLSEAVSALWNERTDRYEYWMYIDTYLSNWAMFLFFVSSTLIASISTVSVNIDKGGSNPEDALGILFIIPMLLIFISQRSTLKETIKLDSSNTKTNYIQDIKLLLMTMYLTTVITTVIQADKEEPILPIVLGGITMIGATMVILKEYRTPEKEFYRPFIYGLAVTFIAVIWAYGDNTVSNKSMSNRYKEKILELNMKFQSILEKDRESMYKVDKNLEGMEINVPNNFMNSILNTYFNESDISTPPTYKKDSNYRDIIGYLFTYWYENDEIKEIADPNYNFYKGVFIELLEIDEKDFHKEIRKDHNKNYVIDWLLNDPIGNQLNSDSPDEPTILYLLRHRKIPTKETVKYFKEYEVDRENNTLLQFVINKYNQFNKDDKETSYNTLINTHRLRIDDGESDPEYLQIEYLGSPVVLKDSIDKDKDQYQEIIKIFNKSGMDIRKLPVMYIPFFGGGQKGVDRMIDHLENSGVDIRNILTQEDKNDISRLYGELDQFNREPSDFGIVFSGISFFGLAYFTISSVMDSFVR